MRIPWAILLACFCIFENMPVVCYGQNFGGPRPEQFAPVMESLTNIAGCLDHLRNHSEQTVSVQVEACITLCDREHSLIVLQDDSGAMAVQTRLTDLAPKPGQRIVIEGKNILPYVRAFPAYPDEPSERGMLTAFEIPSVTNTYYLTRIRGYLHPPVSGQYTFWIAADDAGVLSLSTDSSPDRMQRIATNGIGNPAHSREWNRNPSQQSRPITLKAGETYYIEALHMQSYGSDFMAVAWAGPGIERSVIEGRYLTPWVESSSGTTEAASLPAPTAGLLSENWTNFLIRDYQVLQSSNRDEPIVRIPSLKFTVAGESGLPVPQSIDTEMSLDAVPNLRWVELEGDVDFAAETEDKIQLDLKRGNSSLGVRVLSANRSSVEQWAHAHVRVRGVLQHSSGLAAGLTGDVLWVPDSQQIQLLATGNSQNDNLNRISICDLVPTDPQMNWGRWVNVRGYITGRTTNGMVVVQGHDNYQAFCSADGTNWLPLGKPVEIGMSNSALVGLAVASHHPVELATASFGHLQGLGTNWQTASIGRREQPDNFSISNGVIIMHGGGRKIGLKGDEHYYLYQPLDDGTNICVELANLVRVSTLTQAGLMIRESLKTKAPIVAVLFAPSTGPVFQYRSAYNDDLTGFEARPEYRQFRWMKLVKQKSVLRVQGEPGPEIGTNLPVEVTGMITWQNSVPVLTEAFFQAITDATPPPLPPVTQPLPQISIADFAAKVLHPAEPYLLNTMDGGLLSGIVTFCGDVLGEYVLFVQDGENGGIRVKWSTDNVRPPLEVGQSLEMSGHSTVRRFPVLFEPVSLNITGWGTLPEPSPYSAGLVENGKGQARWVEAVGVVRSQATNGLLNLMTRDGALTVWVGHQQETNTATLVDTLVRMRGVLSMDPKRNARLLVPSLAFVEVQERAPSDPFAVPRFSIAELAGLKERPDRSRRRKVSGVVTCALPGGFYVQDESSGVYVTTGESPIVVRPGDKVEVVGFVDNKPGAVMVSGAAIRKTGISDLPKPIHISAEHFGETNMAGMLVSLEATLLEQRNAWDSQVLTLQMGAKNVEAAKKFDSSEQLPQFPVGSRVEITGVCQIDQVTTYFGVTDSDAARPLAVLKIWLPAPSSVVLLARPPWWTLKRLAWLGGIFAFGLISALIRVRMLRRRVAQKSRELQAAMQRLEKETRTSAVLAERDRLAGEIHDSLEQGLTAIMLQLDAVNRHTDQSPEARKFLSIARNMAEYSRAEVQHAVWDMQSPLLESADLAAALKYVASQISSGSPEVQVQVNGLPRPLSSSHEHHLLRIAQEAMTNAIKHANCHTIRVSLDYSGPNLKLVIMDDGQGFVPNAVKDQGHNGHFGLYGLRARVEKIGGQLEVASKIGNGTVITVKIELESSNIGDASKEPEAL